MSDKRCLVCKKPLKSMQKLYCSNRCKKIYYKNNDRFVDLVNEDTCPFNNGVCCDKGYSKACSKCGWFPKVEAERKERINEQFAGR